MLSGLKRLKVRKEKWFPARGKPCSSLGPTVPRATFCLLHLQGHTSRALTTHWTSFPAGLPPRLLSSRWDTLWRNLSALRMPRPLIRVWHSWNLLCEFIADLVCPQPAHCHASWAVAPYLSSASVDAELCVCRYYLLFGGKKTKPNWLHTLFCGMSWVSLVWKFKFWNLLTCEFPSQRSPTLFLLWGISQKICTLKLLHVFPFRLCV